MNSFWWKLIFIIVFYFFLLILDTAVFHNKISDIKKAFQDKVFIFIFILSLIMSTLYLITHSWDFFPAIIFLMYSIFLGKLIVSKM